MEEKQRRMSRPGSYRKRRNMKMGSRGKRRMSSNRKSRSWSKKRRKSLGGAGAG